MTALYFVAMPFGIEFRFKKVMLSTSVSRSRWSRTPRSTAQHRITCTLLPVFPTRSFVPQYSQSDYY